MDQELDPTTQAIVDKLPAALQDLQAADAELKAKSEEIGDIARQRAELEHGHTEAVTDLNVRHSSRTFEGYSRKLRDIIRQVFAGDAESMLSPPIEDCQRIAELDGLITAAAGQPVVVLKPGRNWIDIGRLEQVPENDHGERTGLQWSFSSRSANSIVLPVHDSVTIDLATADKPTWEAQREDEELSSRDTLRLGSQQEPIRPVIDPLHTRVLPEGKEPNLAEDTESTAHVLVGYTYLQQTLNRIYGFDFEELKDKEDLEVWSKFQSATKIQKRLEEAGIEFDIDFINGCLSYRIDKLESEIQVGGAFQGASSLYQKVILGGMIQKYADLIEAGWISN